MSFSTIFFTISSNGVLGDHPNISLAFVESPLKTSTSAGLINLGSCFTNFSQLSTPTAPKAASEIHTDFEKGFIRAETISYEDFVANNGWVNSKTNGKMRLEGKDYIVKDGDVLNFRFNT